MATTVADLYAKILQRDPASDPAGLAYWESIFGPSVDTTELGTFLSVANVTEPTAAVKAATQNPVAALAVSATDRPTPLPKETPIPAPYSGATQTVVPREVTPDIPSQPLGGAVQVPPPIASVAPKTVNDLYQTFYGTPGDAGGLAYWGGAEKAVTPKDAASWLLWAGKDPSIANKSTGITVDQAYETYLGFKPDETARNYWTGGDPNKELTTAELAAITSEAYGLNPQKGNGLFGSGIGPDVGWVNLRDNLEAAAVVAGNYVLPGSSLLTSQLVTEGAQEGLSSDFGKVANTVAGFAGGKAGNLSNYGKIGEALGLTSGAAPSAATLDAQFISADAAQLAQQGLSQAAIEQNLIAAGVDAFTAFDAAQLALQGIKGTQLEGLLTQSAGGNPLFVPSVTGATTGGTPTTNTTTTGTPTGTGTGTGLSTGTLTPTDLTNLVKAGVGLTGLLGGATVVGGLTGGGGAGNLNLTQQNRSGISSGSAQYSPEYYQQIQAKYNQMMPAQPRDVTTELKNWYETKYAPKVA